MNDHRITSLGLPQEGSDAVTKRWVNLQLKDGMKDIDDLEAALEVTSKALEAEKKRLDRIEKEVAKCLPMAGGAMIGDIDMRGHSIVNLPAPAEADQPVTKGWYAQSWQDLSMAMQGKIDALEEKVKSYHTTDRSKRELDDVSYEDRHIDSLKKLLG